MLFKLAKETCTRANQVIVGVIFACGVLTLSIPLSFRSV